MTDTKKTEKTEKNNGKKAAQKSLGWVYSRMEAVKKLFKKESK